MKGAEGRDLLRLVVEPVVTSWLPFQPAAESWQLPRPGDTWWKSAHLES